MSRATEAANRSWRRSIASSPSAATSGAWADLLDCDEFIPEWEFDRLRAFLETTDASIVPVRFMHFYGSYRVYLKDLPRIIPLTGRRIHRNTPGIEVWGDGANVRIRGGDGSRDPVASETFDVHHFGSVRHPARLRQKWRTQARQHDERNPRWDKIPSFVFNLFPHKWDDGDFLKDLAVYEGPYIQAVRENPSEFTRDDNWLYDRLKPQSTSKSG